MAMLNSVSNMTRTLKLFSTAIGSEIAYGATLNWSRATYDGRYGTFPVITIDTKCVIIMIHGMNSSSGQFQLHINEIEKYNNVHNHSIKMFIPEVINKGMNKLQDCGDDIYSKISSHLDVIHKQKIPVILIGISNGGRVTLYLYSRIMDNNPQLNLYITTLGSPIKGTYLANIALNSGLYRLTKYARNPDVLSDLMYDSELSKQLIQKCEKYSDFKSRTRFYISKQDFLVFPYTCGILDNHDNQIVDGVGHDGLVMYFYKDQVMWCIGIAELDSFRPTSFAEFGDSMPTSFAESGDSIKQSQDMYMPLIETFDLDTN